MKINCSIIDDLLPLYLEDICSEDSKAALEEHLQECSACREKLARMKNYDNIPQIEKQEIKFPIADYARKVKRHRIRVGILVVLISTLAACILSLIFLTIADIRKQANPTVYDVEEGIYNLTSADLETTATEVGEYILYTNSTRIKVSIRKNAKFDGEIILWNATNTDKPAEIGYSHVDSGNNTCIFTNLSSSQRYMVTCDGDEEMSITVSEGREVSFWSSLGNVLGELFNLITER